ncbi:TPA: peptidylprolyl isomerase [Escherichia coli]|uniref:FKBP-type peptidyl-prolyl cis-trans isomerase N-terminal domain-containing protein n=2 Tax=unclassified Escherichia TaxID=2608889 RepID=UPI000CF78B34|nr:FKBP-type peptidyl-prolyl cis-trans isomerase N-terminal domain-containing protein [Escherichia sp. MOD1-EC5110]HAJ7150441.1 peptidylprolyl isomerase [Escherichia coli]HAJ7189713.1 peptidylprolyl isomerase [Escherichia coli]
MYMPVRKFYLFRRLPGFWIGCLLGLLFCLTNNALASDDENIPGILRYAREAERKQTDGKTHPRTTGQDSAYIAGAELKRRLSRYEAELRQLKKENRQLREQMTEMKKLPVEDRSGEVAELKARLQAQNEAHKKSYEALAEKAESDRNQFAEEVIELKQQLAEQEQAGREKASLVRRLGNVQTKLVSTEKENTSLKSALAEVKAKMAGMPVVEMEQLNSSEKQQAYAAGVMMGRDILSLQAANALSGIKTDNRVLLAGVWDALNHREQMNENVLQTSLSQAEQSIHKARQETARKWRKAGTEWLKTFKKQKGVQQDRSGFWYLTEHEGDGELISGDSTVVDVVVVEKLTDGTVVEDMDAWGTVVSQPLGDYPPLFRSALLLLRNHGTITVAAPPELAYGDAGYPPKVPPGATMVYTIRVENVREEKTSPGEQEQEKKPESEKAEEARKS